ncbi:Siderophore biosynthesis non-ribosomal peptide synthetase modules [[Actinomadura] parvosata subsp. kistnae]|uniref:Condensation protein n=1 Tax=[Actinomadura] parvosata subsp. kistnae TaxID=1909395 RepID=A0A1U9ZZM5_9ACTN|nr:phosphopantetheine-binding protein [Nonomuraea sp. ATCC 55076]AQZ63379.1 condensation protein [Nonomuraea sp. ATCC 55076]SPL99097.1 Siderophore biosynthesis non-ribosomal peptide synthetase modules [Actinomadura parvosata subsp. kistnae]
MKELAEIWSELLGLPPDEIPHDVGFLRLGGDSVLAVRMSALVRKRLGVALALSDVRVETTLDDLAELVRRHASGGAPATRALPLTVTPRPDPHAEFPLLPLQQGYFVGQQDGWELSYDSAHYYLDYALTGVDGDEAADALADAVERLAAHQPTLRARVTSDGRQHVLPADAPGAVPQVRVYDLREASPGEIATALRDVRQEMSTHGPDPTSGPGIDVRLTLLPGDEGRLHLGLSLLLFDGWSSSVLSRDLLTFAADWNAALPPLDIHFGDYVTSLADLPATEAWQADRDWWWSRLDTLPGPPALPLAADPQEVRPVTMGNREHRWSAGSWAALRRQCTDRGVTPSTAMLTAFGVVLARWAGHRRMLLNSLQLNRLPIHPEVQRVVGAFAATMLLPLDLAAEATFAELAAAVQATSGEHAAHNLITGVEVGREVARRRGSWRPVGPVVFQSVLGVDAAMGGGPPEEAGPLGQVVASDYFHQLRTPQVAIEVRCFELGPEMVAVFSLVEELFESDQVTAAFDEFVALVDALADGSGWDRLPGLPGTPEPAPGGGLRLGLLPEPAVRHREGPPAGDLEQAVADVFEELLEVPVLDRAADFFGLGGDSLLAVRAVVRLAKEAGASVPVREFLSDPTVAGVAAVVRARLGDQR